MGRRCLPELCFDVPKYCWQYLWGRYSHHFTCWWFAPAVQNFTSASLVLEMSGCVAALGLDQGVAFLTVNVCVKKLPCIRTYTNLFVKHVWYFLELFALNASLTMWTVVLAWLCSCGQPLWCKEMSSACTAAMLLLIPNQSLSDTHPRADFGCTS